MPGAEAAGTGGAADPWRTPERRALRELVADFTTREIVPHLADWEQAGEVPRALHRCAAEVGLLGVGFPEAVGGGGGDQDHQLGALSATSGRKRAKLTIMAGWLAER